MEKKFKCKDEVLIRFNGEKEPKWAYGVVSHETENFVVLCGNARLDREYYDVIPFFGNEHLVGTTDEPEEEITLAVGELILLSSSILSLKEGCGVVLPYKEIYRDAIVGTNGSNYDYCIPISKYNPDNLEETRKWILKVKDGKLVKANLK